VGARATTGDRGSLLPFGPRLPRLHASTLDFGYDERDELTTETTNIPGLATQNRRPRIRPCGQPHQACSYPDGAYVSFAPLQVGYGPGPMEPRGRRSH